jgi:hypothetical protein
MMTAADPVIDQVLDVGGKQPLQRRPRLEQS